MWCSVVCVKSSRTCMLSVRGPCLWRGPLPHPLLMLLTPLPPSVVLFRRRCPARAPRARWAPRCWWRGRRRSWRSWPTRGPSSGQTWTRQWCAAPLPAPRSLPPLPLPALSPRPLSLTYPTPSLPHLSDPFSPQVGAFAARNTRAVHALRYRCRRTARLARWLAGDAALADTYVAGYCGQVPTTTALFLAGMVMQVIHARVARSFLGFLC